MLYGVQVVFDETVTIDDSEVTLGRCLSNSVVVEDFTSSVDLFGKFAHTSRSITIQDTTAPVINFSSDPVDSTVAPEAVPDPVQVSATDSCLLPSTPVVDYIGNVRNAVRICSYSDASQYINAAYKYQEATTKQSPLIKPTETRSGKTPSNLNLLNVI